MTYLNSSEVRSVEELKYLSQHLEEDTESTE